MFTLSKSEVKCWTNKNKVVFTPFSFGLTQNETKGQVFEKNKFPLFLKLNFGGVISS